MAVSDALARTLLAAAGTYTLYLIGLVIYRLYFHPLAKFPGPKYAAISHWHEVYYDVILQGQFTFQVQEMHKQYGPIVRVVPDELHIQDSDFYETLYTKAGRVDKYEWMAGRFGDHNSAFATASDELHRIRRGALNPLFSRQRILDLQDVIQGKIDILVDRVREFQAEEKVMPINRAFSALTEEVILEYCFNLSYDALREPEFEKSLHDPIMAANQFSNVSLQFPWIPKILFNLPQSITVKMQPEYALFFRMQGDFRKQIDDMKSGKMKDVLEKSSHRTVFQELIEGNLPPSEKNSLRLMGEASVVVAAGVVTTGWALATAAFHIINDRPIYQKLRAELEAAIPNPDEKPSWTELEKLPYLAGCVREAVRMSYGVTAREPRLLSKPLEYKGWIIPPRTPVSMTNVDVCDDEVIFPNPRTFRPERWIGNPKAPNGHSLERYYIGFGKGTRSCLGINLAQAELHMTLAALFRNFDFELYQTDISDLELAHDFFAPSPRLDSKGVRIKVKPA
ncbi:uncharacterized protein Z519_08429 [Cladophialophora bantiana CBS 173.52]|uniref:Cytochrome P450 n=1 Tax=Cladophialophora bantiana (strain ATCC 10958 / CBS 173.52 / CDC B-1940 / NIH 8579) TaxID=1442370 RepID=A0A0D2EKU7_CLAB1|nr:uncharacterized protein Z519_08429 [Cladophialophora bantiana CBS 173.52]KIW90646.1 hypothetical protein Z519_08429 [Cladophialophora bantiana CBS 173.52]